ncbi:unnamed protein product [Caenorhabditis nigoni]
MAKSTTPSTKTSTVRQGRSKEASREKEWQRSQKINAAFDVLQQRIPYLRPEERKQMPKIKTLRLALQYIHHLSKLANGNEMTNTDTNETRPLTHTDFRQTVTNELRYRNSYRERAHSQEMDPVVVQRILAREESRRRSLTFPENASSDKMIRQFGPISTNVYNQFNPYQINYVAVQPQMMMMYPINSQMNTPSPDQVNYNMVQIGDVNYPVMENAYQI